METDNPRMAERFAKPILKTRNLNFSTTMNLSHVDPAPTAAGEGLRGALQIESILVPLDLSERSLASLRYAVPFARQFGARITLLHVIQPSQLPADRPPCSAQHRLEEVREQEAGADLDVKTVVRHGCVFDQILSVAREVRADLIVTTTHGHSGLQHLLMGSTAECIVHGAPCAVLVVRERAEEAEPQR